MSDPFPCPQHFTRARLLAFLRSRNHHIGQAAERAIECIKFFDTIVARAREFEVPKIVSLFVQNERETSGGNDEIEPDGLYRGVDREAERDSNWTVQLIMRCGMNAGRIESRLGELWCRRRNSF